ncbi:MAG TPA: Ig-like domain-containing protein [Gemmatimonadaceae bacterium]|nr:Ig-like domain-containing protein [Gemmatimonadaceae bacterium]
MRLAAAALTAFACHRERVLAPIEASYALSIVSGDQQRAPAGSVLPDPLAVLVRDAAGVPVKGVRVVFHVERGASAGSAMLDSIGVTTPAGVATARLELGTALDTTTVVAHPALAAGRSITLVAVATAAPVLASVTPSTFGAGDTLTLRGNGLSIAGGGGGGGGAGAGAAGGGVEVGGVRASALAGATDSAVRVIAPACLTPGPITVRVAAGTVRSNALSALYLSRRAPLVLAPYAAVTVAGAQLAECLTIDGNGASHLVVAQYASEGSATSLIDWRLGANAVAGVALDAGVPAGKRVGNALMREFEATLRRTERAIAPAARAEEAARRRAGAARQGVLQGALAAPPAVGSLRTFNVITTLDGSRFTDVTARLRFAGAHLLIYGDTIGPGFTDAQYRALGSQFDEVLYPIDIAAFGSESDVDGDGHVIALFTPAVNRLVTAQECGQKGYVTGFFYGIDLLVQNPNSNRAEIFFALAPDSAGTFSCPHPAADLLRLLPGTFAHELQHMIAFNQHVLARFGDVEETWLAEGLSHIAEELASKHYEAKFPPPLGRTSAAQIFPDSAGPFIAPQLLNAYVYLNSTRVHSVTSYNGAGSIEERGATWLFLRWLAEQKGEDIFRRLVQTPRTGIANVEQESAEPFGALFGDFSLALWVDSLPGLPRASVPARLRFGTRELRKLMAREATISGFSDPFPLPLFGLRVGGFLNSAMLAGTMTHTIVQTSPGEGPVSLRFTHQDLTPFPHLFGAQVSIFRLPP